MGDQINISKEIALEHIEKAFRLQEIELDLSGWNLKEVPAEIGKLIWLEKLTLEGSGIKTLPKEIGYLRNLKEMNLFNTGLETLARGNRITHVSRIS